MSDFNRLVRMRKAWVDLWPHADEDLVLDAFGRLVGRYTDPARAYHNLAHIDSVLTEFEASPDAAMHRDAVRLALWYHDVIYDTRSRDNEEMSAAFALRELKGLGASAEVRELIYPLIMATKHPAKLKTPDEMLVADLDLSILGRTWPEYLAYAMAIRAEYAWVSAPIFIEKRVEFLENMLERQIYATCYLRAKFDALARHNMKREIDMHQRV